MSFPKSLESTLGLLLQLSDFAVDGTVPRVEANWCADRSEERGVLRAALLIRARCGRGVDERVLVAAATRRPASGRETGSLRQIPGTRYAPSGWPAISSRSRCDDETRGERCDPHRAAGRSTVEVSCPNGSTHVAILADVPGDRLLYYQDSR